MLKNKFKFRLCRDLIAEYGEEYDFEYLAALKGNKYYVSWEEGQSDEDSAEYTILEVSKFVKNKEWVVSE